MLLEILIIIIILVPTYTAYVSSRHYTRTDIAPAASLNIDGGVSR